MFPVLLLILVVKIAEVQERVVKFQGRQGRQNKEAKFEEKRGRESQLQFKSLNSTHLEVGWTNSFDLDFYVIKSVNLVLLNQHLEKKIQ